MDSLHCKRKKNPADGGEKKGKGGRLNKSEWMDTDSMESAGVVSQSVPSLQCVSSSHKDGLIDFDF